jgi:hypothetical protein
MKINLLKLNIIAFLFFAGMFHIKAATNKYLTKADFKISHRIDTSKIMRSINAMPVQTTDTGNYGLHMQISMNSETYAQTGIYFYANASDNFNQYEDAIVVNGGSPLVYIWSYTYDNVAVSINTLADYAKGKRIRLYVNAVYNGNYTMSMADIFNIDTTNYNIFLVDNKLKDSVDIVHTKAYPFTLNGYDTASYGAYRFVLAVEHKAVAAYKLSAFSGEKVSTGVQVNWQTINASNYTGFILQKENSAGGFDSLYSVQSASGVNAYSFTDTHPTMGDNVYRLQQNGISGGITYSGNITIGYNNAAPNGAINVYPNPAKNSMTISVASSTIGASSYVADIYDLSGVHVKHQVVSGTDWTNDVSNYKNGLYIIEIKDTNGNLLGQSKFMKVN